MGPGEHILAVGRAPFAPRRVLSRRAAWRLLVAVLFVALTGCGNESAHRDARDTAQAMGPPQTDAFAGIDPSRWLARQGALQTTTLDAANVTAGAGGLRIAAQANGLHGGELQARQLTGPGWYAWHAKLPELPGSLTGMFLYRTPDGQSELDIELPNDSSGTCWLTSWGRGTRLGSRTVALPLTRRRACTSTR